MTHQNAPAIGNHDRRLSAEQLNDKHKLDGDGEHPVYCRASWREAVGSKQTLLGYWQWVESRIANED